MGELVGLVAVIMTFGPFFYLIKRRYDLKELKEKGGGDRKQLEASERERKLLQERVENLESIVTNVDYELNLRIAKLAKDASKAGLLAAPADPPADEEPATARTLTSGPAGALAAKAAALRDVAAPELELGGVVNQRYRIDRLLGRGGMGAVYLAQDEVLGEHVALKVISSAFTHDQRLLIDRFRNEASAARKVSSPNVIRIHDLGETKDGMLFISMEYFPGKTLADILEAKGALGMRDVRDIVGQICDGLQAAHDAGVIHRDLKPANVLVGERSAVKIIDFGLAKTALMTAMTATGLMVGTPYYMSPEQVRGKEVDARSDIYALGALTYHVVTGQPPFEGETPIAIGFAHVSEEPRPPRELAKKISDELNNIILEALSKDPRDRPRSPAEFRDALG